MSSILDNLPPDALAFGIAALTGDADVTTMVQTAAANATATLAKYYAWFEDKLTQQLQIVLDGGQKAEQGQPDDKYCDPYDYFAYEHPGVQPYDPSWDGNVDSWTDEGLNEAQANDDTNALNSIQIVFNMVQGSGNSSADVLDTTTQSKASLAQMLGSDLSAIWSMISSIIGIGGYNANLLAQG